MKTTDRMPRVIGVTGRIGSGKTTIARQLEAAGFRRLDVDRIGHQVLRRAPIRRQLRRAFGPGIFDRRGRLLKRRLADAAFSTPARHRRLNRIMHPAMVREIRRRLRRARRPIVLDAALLHQMGLQSLCDAVILVTCPKAVRYERARRARGWSAEEVQRRERFQPTGERQAKSADLVIRNSQSPRPARLDQDAARQVRRALQVLRRRM